MTFVFNFNFYRAINTITHKQSILNKKFQEEEIKNIW